HVVVLDLDVGIERVEVPDQRLRRLRVERAVDDDLAFLLRGRDRLRVVGGIAGRDRLRDDGRGERGEGGQGDAWRHASLRGNDGRDPSTPCGRGARRETPRSRGRARLFYAEKAAAWRDARPRRCPGAR